MCLIACCTTVWSLYASNLIATYLVKNSIKPNEMPDYTGIWQSELMAFFLFWSNLCCYSSFSLNMQVDVCQFYCKYIFISTYFVSTFYIEVHSHSTNKSLVLIMHECEHIVPGISNFVCECPWQMVNKFLNKPFCFQLLCQLNLKHKWKDGKILM